MELLEKAIALASDEFMQINEVQGVGQGKTDNDEDCIIIFIYAADIKNIKNKIPQIYDGFKVIVKNICKIEAF
ncbi:MAG: hypothetical protein KIH69_023235 [Anaerolineae bacterium]|nr:hypothetical protein [Anaerolineae bacterium]